MPASHFDVNSMTGRPKFIVRHSTLLLGNFLFLYCNESVLFFLILNIQSGRFEFVKKFDTVRL
jgi:hypothetical protein